MPVAQVLPVKDPLDVLDYSADFTSQLQRDNNDTIATVLNVSSTPPGLIAAGFLITGGTIVTAFISGGVAGITYQLDFLVKTAGNRTYNRGGPLLVASR